jgi:hypothetical protein
MLNTASSIQRYRNVHMPILILSMCFCACFARQTFASEIKLTKTDSGSNVIFVSGQINKYDDDQFHRLSLGESKGVVILSSSGGSLMAALNIGEYIKALGYSTYVASGDTCASACALIWLAGSTRYMGPAGKVGFHASYSDDNGRPTETGVGNAMVGRYMTLLGLPETAVVFATSAPPSGMSWLSEANELRSGIEFELLTTEETGDQSKIEQPDEDSETTSSEKSFNWAKGAWMVFNGSSRCTLVQSFDIQQNFKNNSSLMLSVEYYSKDALLAFHNESFKSLIDGNTYKVTITFRRGTSLDDGWGERSFSAVENEELGNGLHTNLERTALINDIAQNDMIIFSRADTIVDAFPLKGSQEAVVQLRKCLQEGEPPRLSDPFALPQ